MGHGFNFYDPDGNLWPEMKGRLNGKKENDLDDLKGELNDDFGAKVKSYYLRRKNDGSNASSEQKVATNIIGSEKTAEENEEETVEDTKGLLDIPSEQIAKEKEGGHA